MSRGTKKKALSDWLGSGEHQFDGSLTKEKNGLYKKLGVAQLRPGRYQTREDFSDDYIAEVAESIKAVGIIQPIIVRPVDNENFYEIVAGEVRWRAAQRAKLDDVPVIIRDLDDRTAALVTLIENLQRKNLNPIEEAHGIFRLKDEFNLTQEEAADALGKSQSAISRILGLLELDDFVQRLISEGRLEAGHGKVLLGLERGNQITLAEQVAKLGWSVRELERRKAVLLATGKKRGEPIHRDPNIVRLEQYIQTKLNVPVQFKYNQKNGKGQIAIQFNNLEECNGVLERLGLLPEGD